MTIILTIMLLAITVGLWSINNRLKWIYRLLQQIAWGLGNTEKDTRYLKEHFERQYRNSVGNR